MDVHINWCGVFPCEPDWTWDTAVTPLPDFDLWAVFGGSGVMTTPEARLSLSSGDCMVLRPGQRYICHTSADDPLLVHVLHFDFVDARGRPRPPASTPPLHRVLVDVTFFRELTSRAIGDHLAGRSDEGDQWLRAALREIARVDGERARSGDLDPRLRHIEGLCADIAQAPERRWTVRDMAHACAVSPDHFTRLFRRARGVTPREYVLRQRVDAAKRLLLASSHSVGRVAELTGFGDIYHFSRQFKAHTGRSPTRFRRGA